MRKLKLRIELVSDWHVGSGWAAPGHLDSLVARDERGLPFIPAKTVVGIWRDACELVARGLDNGTPGSWCSLVDRIFGTQPGAIDQGPTDYHKDPANRPMRAALHIEPARLPERLQEVLSSEPSVLAALTFAKPGVKIDPVTGQAQEDFLRFEEMCRGGVALSADCSLDLPSELEEYAEALLYAGAAMVQRLGGKRRRGSGRCKFILVNKDGIPIDFETVRGQLEASPPTPESASTSASDEAQPLPSDLTAEPWVSVDLRLLLQTPVLVPHRTVGNVVETLDFVPGYYLLPHVTRALRSVGVDPSDAIAAGHIRVLNAYIEIGDQRGLPAPHVVHAVKDKEGYRSKDFGDSLKNPCLEAQGDAQLKPVRTGYVGWDGGTFVGYKRPSILVRTHSTIDDDVQRPTTAVGGVYSYEAISPGDEDGPVVLRSRLLIRRRLAEELRARSPNWWQRLNGKVRLGRSKKDDYGLAEIIATEPSEAVAAPVATDPSRLYVWLVSDALLRSDELSARPEIDLLRRELEHLLGVDLKLCPKCTFAQRRRFESWNTSWGLPRPSLVTLAAGSCFAFDVSGTLTPGQVARAELEGVGERKAEGFGEIRLNHPALTQPPSAWSRRSDSQRSDASAPSPLRRDEEGYEYARLIEREAWKRIIARRALERATEETNRERHLGWKTRGGSSPPVTQIMAFREQVGRLRTAEDKDQVLQWFHRLKQSRNRKPKWEESGALKKCEELIRNPDKVWTSLGLHQPGSLPHVTEDAEDLRNELWAYAVRCLVDAYARAHKRHCEEQSLRA